MNSRATLWIAALIALLAATPAPAADREAGLTQLVGVWQLDQRVSEDPRRMLRDFQRRGAPGPPGEGPPDLMPRVDLVTQGANVLTVAYADRTLTFTDWDDETLSFPVDGKRHAVARRGTPVEIEASWKSSDRLIVRTTGLPGGWIRETYELGQRGTKLFVTVELQLRGKRVFAFDRLYNRGGSPLDE